MAYEAELKSHCGDLRKAGQALLRVYIEHQQQQASDRVGAYLRWVGGLTVF